jgi:thioredoxin-like negative regulator of GroEL
VRFVRLDVAANPASPAQWGVLGLPTLILFRGGEPLGRWATPSKEQLRQQLRKLL